MVAPGREGFEAKGELVDDQKTEKARDTGAEIEKERGMHAAAVFLLEFIIEKELRAEHDDGKRDKTVIREHNTPPFPFILSHRHRRVNGNFPYLYVFFSFLY